MASVPIRSSRTCCCTRVRAQAITGLLKSTRWSKRASTLPITVPVQKRRGSISRWNVRSILPPAKSMCFLRKLRVCCSLISNGFYAATKRKGQSGADRYEPTLAAATKDLGDRVEIRIRDNGTGIPPDVKDKMFNPFFTTKPAGEGTGLGLSISHDIIVKQHAGSIEVDTRPGEFTEFRIVLTRTA